jgi:Na+/proline symporter
MLLLGGAAVATSLTGMNIYAACFLIPLGIIIYILFGGLRATFLTDYVHTVALFIIILVFGFTVWVTSPKIGSPGKMVDLLNAVSKIDGPAGNAENSYLTMDSYGGVIFGIINIVGNFGTVFCDQAYWQRACKKPLSRCYAATAVMCVIGITYSLVCSALVAARPSATVQGYLVGGLCWFSIPFFLATTLGLAGVALEGDSDFQSNVCS